MDTDVFCRGMRRLTGAVTVIATRAGEEKSGLTATAVCSFSAKPPRLLTCVNVRGKTFGLLAASRCMSVNVLAWDQESIARRFAGLEGTSNDDHFLHGQWCELATGAPVLKSAIVSFDCTIDEMFVAHTHAMIIGEVRDVLLAPFEAPLLYLDGKFTTLDLAVSMAGAGRSPAATP